MGTSSATTFAPVPARSNGGRVRYLGSKARIVEQIIDLVGEPDGGTFVDPFSGTGVVAEAAGVAGWPVRAGDLLLSAVNTTAARLFSYDDAPFEAFGGYEDAIATLNAVRPRTGFFTKEYTPHGPAQRYYFTVLNGRKIDAYRAAIRTWRERGELTDNEHTLLLADLVRAANRVANIAGTYGCFLSSPTSAAMRPIELVPSDLKIEPIDFEVVEGDASSLPVAPSDTLYLDPPYTKRQYAAYYHIPETIAHEDNPAVDGKTGLRPWRDRASDYCYKTRAHHALVELIRETSAQRVLLSYSDEGHVQLDDLAADLEAVGEVRAHVISDIGRYRPNVSASASRDAVTEYVLEVLR